MPLLLAWLAAIFEAVLVICFLTGAFFTEAALLAAAYVLFLAFAFHGPSHWAGNQAEFGFFIDHFTFIAGLLFAAVNGPGRIPGAAADHRPAVLTGAGVGLRGRAGGGMLMAGGDRQSGRDRRKRSGTVAPVCGRQA